MNKKVIELLEDERARHEGRYYDAGVWLGLNWVLEEAKREDTKLLDVVGARKEVVLEDLQKARKMINNKKEPRYGYSKGEFFRHEVNTYPADGALESLLAGELEGLEKALELLKKL